MTYVTKRSRAALALALGPLLSAPLALAQEAPEKPAAPAPSAPQPDPGAKLDAVVKERISADDAARASQKKIEQLDDETQKLLTEYRKAVADKESYDAYARQLEAQVRSQDEEIASIHAQLLEIENTSREISPMMPKMVDTLGQFVELDLPFLPAERTKRVAALREMLDRADVTLAEKYRRILEGYQVELDYGRTIETYEGELGEGGDVRTVQFLRVGRVALLYQTLDGQETGYWDAGQKKWVIDNAYAHGFKEGLAVAKKSKAPEMLIVPVPAPKEAKS